jgi:DeoR/GlpR family transcriptional regulator of sugar metabolism
MKIGKELIIVADHTKFGTISTIRTAHLNEVDLIVTSNYTPLEVVNKIRQQGTRVICA